MYKRNKSINKMKRPVLSQVAFVIFGLIVVLIISFPLAKNISKQYKINKEIEELEKEISGLRGKNTDLKSLIGYLDSDEFIEEQARLNLNYMKSGEQLVVVKESEPEPVSLSGAPGIERMSPASPRTANGGTNKEESNFYNWYRYFFNKFL